MQLGVAVVPCARQQDIGGAQKPLPQLTPCAPVLPPLVAAPPAVAAPALFDDPPDPPAGAPLAPSDLPAAPADALTPALLFEVQATLNAALKNAVRAMAISAGLGDRFGSLIAPCFRGATSRTFAKMSSVRRALCGRNFPRMGQAVRTRGAMLPRTRSCTRLTTTM